MATEKRGAHNRKQPDKTRETALELRAVSPGSPAPVSVSRPSPELGAPLQPSPAVYLATGSATVYHEVRSRMHPAGFQIHEGSAFPASLIHEKDAKGQVELRPVELGEFSLLPPEETAILAEAMQEQASKLSSLDADTLDSLCIFWAREAKHPDAKVYADIDDFLKLRSLKPKKDGRGRRGGYETEQRQEQLASLARIQNLWLNMEELGYYEDNGKKSKKNRRQVKRGVRSRVFTITDLSGQIRLDGSLDTDRIGFVPGSILSLYLWGPGRQTALIDQQILSLDPYRQDKEKSLGRYFSQLWRNRAHNASYSDPLRVSTLLEKATITVNESRPPGETKARLEKALNTLQSKGIIAAWRYVSWAEADAPARGWLPGWLSTLVVVEAPQEVKSHYIENLSGALPELTEETPLEERLRATRTRLELTQEQAAEDAGLSQQTYSRAERGSSPSVPTLKKLEAWLERHK